MPVMRVATRQTTSGVKMMNTREIKPVKFVVWLAACIFSFGLLQEILAPAESVEAAPASDLIYSWVDEGVEAELPCDFFEQCLHYEVIDTAQCKQAVIIHMGFVDTNGNYITSEDVIVPSPRFAGGFVIEVGTNMRPEVGLMDAFRVGCSTSAPNIFGDV